MEILHPKNVDCERKWSSKKYGHNKKRLTEVQKDKYDSIRIKWILKQKLYREVQHPPLLSHSMGGIYNNISEQNQPTLLKKLNYARDFSKKCLG